MFFAENYYGVDDGLLAACKIVEIIAREPGPASRALRLLCPGAPHAGAQGPVSGRREVPR